MAESDSSLSDFEQKLMTRSGSNRFSPYIHNSVSQWNIKQVENNLKIYYNCDVLLTASDLLEKINRIGQLTDEQRKYGNILKTRLEKLNFALFRRMKLLPRKVPWFEFDGLIDEILEKLLEEEANGLTRYRIGRFLKSLRGLSNDVKRNPDHVIYEESYTKLFVAFAEMCCLHACLTLGKGDESVWKNLRGTEIVTSRPDIRLMKTGLDITKIDEFESPLVVSVVQVEKDCGVEGMTSLCERLESSSLDSSFNSGVSSEAESKRPRIEEFFNERVLGQHAGELLLDLHTLFNPAEMLKLSMPGMIVNKTEVVLTLLEISHDHLKKLESSPDEKLDEKATIYYSQPFDIMDSEDRAILIDSLIRLNNIEYKHN